VRGVALRPRRPLGIGWLPPVLLVEEPAAAATGNQRNDASGWRYWRIMLADQSKARILENCRQERAERRRGNFSESSIAGVHAGQQIRDTQCHVAALAATWLGSADLEDAGLVAEDAGDCARAQFPQSFEFLHREMAFNATNIRRGLSDLQIIMAARPVAAPVRSSGAFLLPAVRVRLTTSKRVEHIAARIARAQSAADIPS
jgi:hypothetical protein